MANKFIKGLKEKLTMLSDDWFVIQPDAEESIAYKIKQSNLPGDTNKLDKLTASDQSVASDVEFAKNINVIDKIGVDNDSPETPIHVGDQPSQSGDAQIIIAREVTDNGGPSAGVNAHAFSDSSVITRSGQIGYNSFDARIIINGTEDYDHFATFQDGSTYNSSGTLDDMYSLFATLIQNAGTITNRHGLFIANPTVNAGTIVNNYGIHVKSQNSGTNNWAIITELGLVEFGENVLVKGKLHVGDQAFDGTTEHFLVKQNSEMFARFWADGRNFFDIKIDATTGTSITFSDVSDIFQKFNNNAGVETNHNGVKKLETVDDGVKVSGGTTFTQVAEPSDPALNEAIEWYSNGTGAGDAGDKMIKINVGGIVKTTTLIDYSALP